MEARRPKRPLLHEIASEKFSRFQCEQENRVAVGSDQHQHHQHNRAQSHQRQRQPQQQCGGGIAAAAAASAGAGEQQHYHQQQVDSNNNSSNNHNGGVAGDGALFLSVPQVHDRSTTRTPEWQAAWRCPVAFTRPLEVGAFKRTLSDRNPQPTREPPPAMRSDLLSLVGSNLNENFGEKLPPPVPLDDGTMELEHTLGEAFDFDLEKESINFISYRNNINKIMATPYERFAWKMKVYRRRGTIHLEVIIVEENNESNYLVHTQHWGRQFDALCKGLSAPSKKVEHCAFFKAKLNSHRLLVAAELDVCRSKEDPTSYIQIKTAKAFVKEDDRNFFLKKILRFWIQCYLVGIESVVVGFRDDSGMLVNLESYDTLKIPAMVDIERDWDMNVCLNFTDRVFAFLQQHVVEGENDDDGGIGCYYTLEYRPNQHKVFLKRII